MAAQIELTLGQVATGGYPAIPPPTPWLLAQLGGAIRGHWNAQAIAGKSPGDLIDSLASSSGATNTLSQATSGYRPSYQLLGGRGALLFDGVDDHMGMSDLSVSNGAEALVLFTLIKRVTIGDANYKYLMTVREGGSSNARMAFLDNNTASPNKKTGATSRIDGGATSSGYSAVNVDTNLHVEIAQVIYNGDGAPSMNVWRDGALILGNTPSFTPAALPATNSLAAYVGANGPTANSAINALFLQCGIIRGQLTTDLRRRVEGRLAWDGGIQASLTPGHPYIDVQPTV